MVFTPDSLVWELVKKNNCFIKQTNGRTKRSGMVKFSSEKGNVKSLHQFQCSGLANSKVADVSSSATNGGELYTKTASKAHTKPKAGKVITPVNKDFRRVEAVINKQVVDNYYRRDLKAALLAKWTKVYQANRRAKGIKKPVPVKKGRGKN
jgi:large subunit ribosomal protein L28e